MASISFLSLFLFFGLTVTNGRELFHSAFLEYKEYHRDHMAASGNFVVVEILDGCGWGNRLPRWV
jgi:hypothetical protein